MTPPLQKPPRKDPLQRTRQPLLPPHQRSRTALGLTAAAAEGRFALQVCAECDRATYPPRDKTAGLIQPAVVSLGGRHLRFYARSQTRTARIAVADSNDAGKTWTQPHFIDLPNPNSGIDAVGLRDGRIVLLFNNSYNHRTPLNLAVSRDGEHFTIFKTLEDTPGEYSYPAIVQAKNGDQEGEPDRISAIQQKAFHRRQVDAEQPEPHK